MRIIIQNGALPFVDEGLLAAINNSLEYAKRRSTTPTLLCIYRMQLQLAEKFLTEQKRDLRFTDLTGIDKERLNNLIIDHKTFLKETKQ